MFWLTIHTALLILAAYVIGCTFGCLARLYSGRAAAAPGDSTASIAPPPQAAPARVTTPAPVRMPEPAPAAAPSDDSEDLSDEEAEARLAALADTATNEERADAVGRRPSGIGAPRDGAADDLKRIKGIGKVNEQKLNGLGVYHFDQIADWSKAEARWVGTFLAFAGRIEGEDWIGQAKVLASGGTTEFAARVDGGDVPSSQA
ncbi:MAG: hypothetical protein KDJ16_10400 [Hyphomicrobiales bacterium]|nr:hypothetical protein [Hyphomicrobiales bacterium]